MELRAPQAEILKYDGGRLAISAVPGSGKTFILSHLAAQLIADNFIDVNRDQQVLIVTYLNSSVDTFRNRIRTRLEELGLTLTGFDVRTLHSLALEIVRISIGEFGGDTGELLVADEAQSNAYISTAVDGWIANNRELWLHFVADEKPATLVRWREITAKAARSLISIAKNQRYEPAMIFNQLDDQQQASKEDDSFNQGFDQIEYSILGYPFLWMMAGIYRRYQNTLNRAGALDFNDIIWEASNILDSNPETAGLFRQRWPVVLEDEAQDSVPLQELLLSSLTGPNGNWVRAGDPNQAITSSFTAAHPSYFSRFLARSDVTVRSLPHSGRSARKIYQTANTMMQWTHTSHPVEEVRNIAFYLQDILPTPPGDSQPNPPDREAKIEIRVYKHREEVELPTVARHANKYCQSNPSHTVAILVSTNRIGHMVASHLDNIGADYDDLLRGVKRLRELASTIQAILAVLSSPIANRNIVRVHESLAEINHPLCEDLEDSQRISTLLRSIHSPEMFLYPDDDLDSTHSLPSDIATVREMDYLQQFSDLLLEFLELRALPADEMILAISDLLFVGNRESGADGNESDLATSYQIAQIIGRWRDLHPEWRLPELAAQLQDVASGRLPLRISGPTDFGYQPSPGRITLATQHGAKGMEWDAVYLVGIDGHWIPSNLESSFMGDEGILGADPIAEMTAEFQLLMSGSSGIFENRTATETAHIELICERLRLLYVGITRAKRYLHISRSRKTKSFQTEYEVEPTTVMQAIYQFVNQN